MLQHGMKNFQPQRRLPINPNLVIWALVIVLIGILVPPTVSKLLVNLNTFSSNVVADTSAVRLTSSNRDERVQAITQLGQAANAGSAEAVTQLGAYFQRNEYLTLDGLQTARALAAVDSRTAYQVLIHALRSNQPATRRMAAMTALEEAKPTVARMLVASLQDPDAGVRAASAELIGYRKDGLATEALTAATYDPDPTVRQAATWTLGGDLAVWSSLSRIQLLGIADSDPRVRDAAHLAEARIESNIARALGLDAEDIRFVTPASAHGQYYVATMDSLYAVQDSTTWHQASTLPDVATALAAGGADGQTVYLGTIASGLFKSDDGGATWQSVRAGLPNVPALSVTSLAIEPAAAQTAQNIYVGLAVSVGTVTLHSTALGVYRSADGGATWSLVDETQDATGLAIDPATPKVLYGMNETGVWQTPVP